MTLQELNTQITKLISDKYDTQLDLSAVRATVAPDGQNGDFASNGAFIIAKQLGRNPREVALELSTVILEQIAGISKIEVAGPGFLNITLTDEELGRDVWSATARRPNDFATQVIVTEYSDPNPFKVLHVGHLYTSVVGDAITNLVRLAGGEVHAVNFGGDVGLHVARTMWAIIQDLGGEYPEKLSGIAEDDRSEWMARCYVVGTRAYDDDESAKQAIIDMNKKIYEISATNDRDTSIAQIYWTCRQWSYDYFDKFYARIGTKFEKYYPESETAPIGLATVKEQLDAGVYEESDGAVVFNGAKYGLHTRVFINSNGLPTYEAKDVGLIMAKWRDYSFDRSIIITGNDIIEYMKVVLKSIEQFRPDLAQRTAHITHGNVKLAGSVKMASRKGNFLRAVEVLDLVAEAGVASGHAVDESVTLGAIKYAFLNQRIGADLVFIPEESVSLEGNSGPYLQYAHARARSILAKSTAAGEGVVDAFELGERSLAMKICEYPDVLDKAVSELMPHYICTYLYELAQVFNRFYEENRVVGGSRERLRIRLVTTYADILRDGLTILGITAPDRL
jgi:arginyl-tRNA synthetase